MTKRLTDRIKKPRKLKVPSLGTPTIAAEAKKLEGLRERIIADRIARKKRIRASAVKSGGATEGIDREIKRLEERAKIIKKDPTHRFPKSDARTRVGGGSPGSFVAGGLARKGR